jgi:hypothetical protein
MLLIWDFYYANQKQDGIDSRVVLWGVVVMLRCFVL